MSDFGLLLGLGVWGLRVQGSGRPKPSILLLLQGSVDQYPDPQLKPQQCKAVLENLPTRNNADRGRLAQPEDQELTGLAVDLVWVRLKP